MRDSTTPDCGVTGCKRAAYKYGICRRHHSMLPWSFRMDYVGAVFATYDRMNKKAARLARAQENLTKVGGGHSLPRVNVRQQHTQ